MEQREVLERLALVRLAIDYEPAGDDFRSYKDCKSCKIETDLTQKQYNFNCNKGPKLEQNYDRLF